MASTLLADNSKSIFLLKSVLSVCTIRPAGHCELQAELVS